MGIKAQVLIEMDTKQFKTFFSAFIIDSFNRFNQFSVYLLTNFITVKHYSTLLRIDNFAMCLKNDILCNHVYNCVYCVILLQCQLPLCNVCMTDALMCVQGAWEWSDGTALDYTPWWTGQPNGGTSQNCILMYPDQTWWDLECNSTRYYVCKSCPSGWQLFESRCYLVGLESSVTWADAEKDCINKGGHLASIHSAAERNFIHSLYSSSWLWLGGTDAAVEVSFTI